MKQNNKLEFHIPLMLAIALLLGISVPTLTMPYCYSEAQLMGDSILYLKSHGIGSILADGSLQLPDLFSVIYSYIARYIAATPLIMHISTYIFAAISIIGAYQFGKFFFSVQAGVMSASIMCVQNIFIAQTGLVLPIMMLNSCIIVGVYLFFREKYLLSMMLMCLASLTDILGLVAAVFVLIAYFMLKYREWTIGRNIMFAAPIIIWFAYQGISIMLCSKTTIRPMEFALSNFVDNIKFIFVDQYRFVLTGVLAIMLIINTINKNMQYFVKDMAKRSALLMLMLYIGNSCISNTESWNLTAISILAIFAGCTISTLHLSYYTKYMIACGIIISSALSTINRSSITDADVNYKSKIKVDSRTVKIITDNIKNEEIILCDKYFNKYLTMSELGYIPEGRIYNCESGIEDYADYCKWAIYSTYQPDSITSQIPSNKEYEKINTILMDNYSNEIYKCK